MSLDREREREILNINAIDKSKRQRLSNNAKHPEHTELI